MSRHVITTLALLLLVACSSRSASEPKLPYVPRPLDTTGPYVVTAIDYHFHDAHPTQPLSLSRTLVVHNDSVHLHNVTIPEADLSQDVQPGDDLRIAPLSSLLSKPGRYRFYCVYHVDRGMKGLIVIR